MLCVLFNLYNPFGRCALLFPILQMNELDLKRLKQVVQGLLVSGQS